MTKAEEIWVQARKNRNHGIQPLQRVLTKYGTPQEKIKTIHIAGTNGKGSTSYMLAHILQANGYKVGLFTSPHLVTHRDRIRINDMYITEERFSSYLNRFKEDIEQEDLGMFEIDCLIAFQYFYDEHVDMP